MLQNFQVFAELRWLRCCLRSFTVAIRSFVISRVLNKRLWRPAREVVLMVGIWKKNRAKRWSKHLKHNGRGRAAAGCVQEIKKKRWWRGVELQKVIGYSSAALWARCGRDTCGVTFPSLFQTHSTFFAEVVTFPSIVLRLTYGRLFHSRFSYPAGSLTDLCFVPLFRSPDGAAAV